MKRPIKLKMPVPDHADPYQTKAALENFKTVADKPKFDPKLARQYYLNH